MKTCTLRHRGGIIQDHHPESINRFVQDPEHGLLALIFGDAGLRPYPLDMTIEEAREAFEKSTAVPADESVRIGTIALRVAELNRLVANLQQDVGRQEDRWTARDAQKLDIRFDKLLAYLGVDSDWEDQLDTGEVEVPCLPGIQKSCFMRIGAIAETVERIDRELFHEDRSALADIGNRVKDQLGDLRTRYEVLERKVGDHFISFYTRWNQMDNEVSSLREAQGASQVVQGHLFDSIKELRQAKEEVIAPAAHQPWTPPAPGGEAARGWVMIREDFTTDVPIIVRWVAPNEGRYHKAFDQGERVTKSYIGDEYMEIPQ